MKLFFLAITFALIVVACGTTESKSTGLKRLYIPQFPGATIGCREKTIDDRHYIVCASVTLEGRYNAGLWEAKGGTYYAINGKAIAVAEKVGLPISPDRHITDIPAIRDQVWPE